MGLSVENSQDEDYNRAVDAIRKECRLKPRYAQADNIYPSGDNRYMYEVCLTDRSGMSMWVLHRLSHSYIVAPVESIPILSESLYLFG